MASERRPEKPPARHRSGRSSLCVYARSFRLSFLIGRRHKRRPSPPACTTTTHHHHPKNLKPFRPSFPILDWTPDNIGTAAQLSGVLLRAFGASPSIYTHTHTQTYRQLSSRVTSSFFLLNERRQRHPTDRLDNTNNIFLNNYKFKNKKLNGSK